jgi:Ser/Thr protein kinase RdoA (MazF antagonist)
MSLEQAAREVLDYYPVATGCSPDAQGNRGGFSGARLWRLPGGPAGPLCLRAWPTPGPGLARLRAIHQLMQTAVAAGLSYVPVVFPTRGGPTWVEYAGRLWEVTAWMPGRADFRQRPTSARLRAACTALARLHQVWARSGSPPGPNLAIGQRLACAREWLALVSSGWTPNLGNAEEDPVLPWARRAWRVLPPHVGRIEQQLAPWVHFSWRVQPCLCDVWHDHVLFEGDAVSGLVDYGGVKPNHVAADLARLLGSLAGDDREMWEVGLVAYREVGPLSAAEGDLAVVLDRTGTVLGVVHWLRWLYLEGRPFADRTAVARRLAEIVTRLESW